MADIIGTEGDDILVGTSGIDNFIGLSGSDDITIGFGDSADGGSGTDQLRISLADYTEGVSFDTTGLLGPGPVTLFGGTIRNFEILASITGTAFSDYITVGTQTTTLTISGGAGFDVVYGGGSAIIFNGGDDGDTFNSGSAADTFNGGAGIDTIVYFSMNVGGALTLGLNPGQVGSGYGGDVLIDVENVLTSAFYSYNDTVTGSNADNQISTYGGNDTIYGMGGNDSIQGGEGDDWIEGGLGNDLLRGNAGSNHLIGGEGSDIYFYSDGAVPTSDVIVELVSDPGNDVLRIDPNGQAQIQDSAFTGIRNIEIAELGDLNNWAGFDYILGAQFQSAGFVGVLAQADIDASAITAGMTYAISTVNIRDLTLVAGSGADLFSFGDTLVPGPGRQFVVQQIAVVGGAGYDIFRLSGGSLQETGFVGGRLTLSGIEEIQLLAGANAQAVAGGPDIAGTARSAEVTLSNGLVDPLATIMVNASALRANVVTGLGLDGELGGAGNDADTLSQETLTLVATTLTGGRTINATGGAAGDSLGGGDGNDRLDGGGGADLLDGQGGDDLLIGGLGRDTLTGYTGSDTFVFRAANESVIGNRDRIIDFQTQTDRIDLYAIDADSNLAGPQLFSFIGSGSFTGSAGQLRYSGGTLAGDTNGDGIADFEIEISNNTVLTAVDLNLNNLALTGGTGNNRIYVSPANSGASVDGGAGTDTLAVSGTAALAALAGIEAIDLTGGAALALSGAQVNAGLAANTVLSGTGSLTITMAPTDLELYLQQYTLAAGANVAITINGSAADDAIKGILQASNAINGGAGGDQIRGGALGDTIDGGDGDDKLIGANGADILTGGLGADTFRFQAASHSGVGAAADRITDFQIGTDRLGFAAIDTDAVTPGDQAFAFIGNTAFHASGAAEMRYMNSGANLLVQADLNGDGIADMEVVLAGLAGQVLTSGDFLL